MADLIRVGGSSMMTTQKDKLGSPSTGSEDGGGGVDLAELAQELDHDEFDGQVLANGERGCYFFFLLITCILKFHVVALNCCVLIASGVRRGIAIPKIH